jgi:hypothetical protein
MSTAYETRPWAWQRPASNLAASLADAAPLVSPTDPALIGAKNLGRKSGARRDQRGLGLGAAVLAATAIVVQHEQTDRGG